MLKFFKNLFGSGQAEGNANGNGYATPYAPAQNQTDVAEAEPAIEAQPTHYAAAPSAPAQAAYASNTGVRVSLQAIIAVLPLELRTRVQQTAVSGVFVTLPVGRVVSQLAAGAVRMTFGELRAACPNAFSPQADRDTLQIALPLNEILPQINPALLPRRQAQRQVQVPEEVTGPFGNDGFGVTFAETRTITGTPVAGAPEPLPEPTPVAPPPPPPTPVAPRAVQPPKPVPFTPPPRAVQPQPPKPAAPAPAPTFTPKPAPMVPKPAPVAPQPIAMKPPQAPIAPKPAPMPPQAPAMRPAPAAPQPPAVKPPSAPFAPQPPAAKTNVPTPPVPFRNPNPFASTPTPPAPPATPSGPPPGRPAFPAARGPGGPPQAPAAPRMPSNGSNGNGNAHVPPAAPIQFNQFQRAPQAQPAPQVPEEQVFFQRAPQPQQPPPPQQSPQFQQAPVQFQPAPQFQQAPAQPAVPEPHVNVAPQPAASAAPEICLDASLAMLSESWPEVLRAEIEQSHLSGATLSLPLRIIEPALKQGRIVFPWKVLRSFIHDAAASPSAHDGMMLELPLSVIAPLFVARQKEANAARQKIELDENIPNLFFGFPQPDSPAEEEPADPTPASQEAPEEIFTPAQKSKQAGVPDTNFYVWGDSNEAPQVDETEFKRKDPSVGTEFLSRYATPNEIVSRAAALEGVLGALVALPDGLMVASKLSADLNGDTLAAFLPHIFGKVSQCTKELRMGELNNLNFTVGNVPWKIYRVNSIFFAAFGRAGQALPTAQLSALAAELDRKKQ